jgi:hypothetical protein
MLNPSLVISGHGVSMSGDALKQGLLNLDENFDSIAVPDHGKYVDK